MPFLDRFSGHVPADPAEPWETPVGKSDPHKLGGLPQGRPFRPNKLSDVPAPAIAAFESLCGSLPLDRLYVIPRTSRLVSQTQCVVTPTEVLGFGDTTIGLWIDDGSLGHVRSIAAGRVLAVDDRTILLCGRLRLMSPDGQIVVRYNTISRPDLQRNLAELRGHIAGQSFPTVPGFLWLDPSHRWQGVPQLPHKWRVVLDNRAVRPDELEPVAVAAGDLAEVTARHARPASGVAVLGPRELVIANEPVDYMDPARFGVDLLAVPRGRLESLNWDGRCLTVRSAMYPGGVEAVSVSLPLDPSLVEAMWYEFGNQVPWA
jgi:hypothetical protein